MMMLVLLLTMMTMMLTLSTKTMLMPITMEFSGCLTQCLRQGTVFLPDILTEVNLEYFHEDFLQDDGIGLGHDDDDDNDILRNKIALFILKC